MFISSIMQSCFVCVRWGQIWYLVTGKLGHAWVGAWCGAWVSGWGGAWVPGSSGI